MAVYPWLKPNKSPYFPLTGDPALAFTYDKQILHAIALTSAR